LLWIATVVVLVTAVTLFSVVSGRRVGTQEPPTGRLAGALAERVVTLMETDFRDVTAPHGGRVVCVARPFGVRPEGLTRAAQATTIYAWVYCRGAGESLLAPVAVRLGRKPSMRTPTRGEDHERSLRRIFPADVRESLSRTDRAALRSALDSG
jgi:hypothetical protein